jgi:hypothetical protein
MLQIMKIYENWGTKLDRWMTFHIATMVRRTVQSILSHKVRKNDSENTPRGPQPACHRTETKATNHSRV